MSHDIFYPFKTHIIVLLEIKIEEV
jgi:hypothetical protein